MTWAIGDIQGCFDSLEKLLKKIDFNPNRDNLWFVGDLVNRGPKGLEVLDYLYSIKDSIKVVLGNHDIALIAAYYGLKKSNPTIEPILSSKKADILIAWLKSLPFLHIDKNLGYAMAHAGVAPNFTLDLAKKYNDILQSKMQSSNLKEWLQEMMSKDDTLEFCGDELQKQKYALSSFIRMRYCYSNNKLDFKQKGSPKELKNSKLYPWFDCPNRVKIDLKIVFGHWSTLGFINKDDILALDTGCVWKRELSAFCLEENILVQVDCK